MDNQEAKFILRAYRPNGADAANSQFSEALEQSRRDPALGEWFEREQKLDRVVAEKLRAVAPPLGLRNTILTGARVSSPSRSVWHQPTWMGLAAAAVIAVGTALGWPRLQARVEADKAAAWAMDDTLHGQHGGAGEAVAKLESFLGNSSTRLAGATLPVTPEQLRATGCRTIRFGGRDVAEICFVHAGTEYHLYVMTGAPRLPASPKILEQPGAAAAAWSDGHYGYILATAAGTSALKALL